MRDYASAEELWTDVLALADRLEAGGLGDPAAELREGVACLNGLTDGWAMLLEAVERVRTRWRLEAAPDDRAALARIRRELRRVVYGPRG